MKKSFLISILSILLSSIHVQGNVPKSSVSAAAGGGGAASVEAGESSFMNPASIPHLKGRYFYSSFQKNLFALSLIENDKQSAVPGSFGYFADDDLQMFSLSLADFILERVSMGLSLTYWQAEFNPQEKRQTSINANAGLLWTPFKDFGVGFAAENMFSPNEEFKQNSKLIPTSRLGLNYLYTEWFRWRLDFVTLTNNRWDNWIPQAGFESYASKWFILRVGVSRRPQLKESWSAGFGLDLPRFKVDYASQWHVDGGNEQRHSVDLGVPF